MFGVTRRSISLSLVATFLVLAVHQQLVAGVHPKHINSAPIGRSELDRLQNDDEELPFFRIRRQNNRGPHISGIRQLVPILDQLTSKVRSLENKLMRHEYRESQVADFTSKALNGLSADNRQTKSSLEQMAKQLAAVEERVMATFSLVSTSDEVQRGLMGKLSEGLDRLLLASTEPSLGRSPNALPELPPDIVAMSLQTNADMNQNVKDILRKVTELDGSQDSRLRGVASEVRQINDVVSNQLMVVNSQQENIISAVQACSANEVVSHSSQDSEGCQKIQAEVKGRLELLTQMQQGHGVILQDLKENTATGMEMQRLELRSLLREIRQGSSNYNGSFEDILEALKELDGASEQNLGNLHSNLKSVVEENSGFIQKRIEALEGSVNEAQANLMGAIDDSASMTDNLQITVSDNYELLSKEIGGLNKVEQVMINTADAVLDTKRSIEFGIQQVILELSEIVSKSGSTINATLFDQMNNISFNILKNQTSALTNMTRRMEGEISQVWRQIGIMYQQVEQSINMLGNLQDTTDQHMNVSLSRVGSMDGTVGEISGKVASVEDNLNYLLGRLTLVLSEFNHMKTGVGNELDRLREMAQEITIPDGDDVNKDNLKYNINRKRHIIGDYGY